MSARDPFIIAPFTVTADQADTLKSLNAEFSCTFTDIGWNGTRWHATPADRTRDTIRGLTPDDLRAAMRASGAR